MDILYIVGKGASEANDFELRMSLRSIAKYGKNVGRVFVVGYCPDWLSDEVVRIPNADGRRVAPGRNINEKSLNIMDNVMRAVELSDIGEEFLISMDDHFYVKETDFDNYPYYAKDYIHKKCRHFLPEKVESPIACGYEKILINTRKFLVEHGLSVVNFAPHRNMHCSRGMIEGCEELNREIMFKRLGIECFCLWLNWQNTKYGIDYEICKDVKIGNPAKWEKASPEHTHVFSTSNFHKEELLGKLIMGLYPEPCKYEKA